MEEPMNRVAIGIGVAFLVGWSALANAQTGFAVDRFDPSERGSEWFVADSLDLRGQARPAVGIVFDWAYKPLVIYNADGSEHAALLEDQVVLHPGASLVLWNRLRVGADIPVAVVNSGTGGTVDGVAYTPSGSASIGDVRLSADARLFGEYGDAFTLAGGAAVYLPSGSQTSFTSDGTVRVEPRLLAAGRVGSYFVYAAHLGVDIRPQGGSFAGTELE
jgi:OOP family OmpA-OmpF porin